MIDRRNFCKLSTASLLLAQTAGNMAWAGPPDEDPPDNVTPTKKGEKDPCREIARLASNLRQRIRTAKSQMNRALNAYERSIRRIDHLLKTKSMTKGERASLRAYGSRLMSHYDKMNFQARGKSAPWVPDLKATIVEPFDKKAEKYIRSAEKLLSRCRKLSGRARKALVAKARKKLMTAHSIIKSHVTSFNSHLQQTNRFVSRNAGRVGLNGDMAGKRLKKPVHDGTIVVGKLAELKKRLDSDRSRIAALR